MDTQPGQVLVIGGGIGGLAAAVALQRRGISVAVYEQAYELREIGAGLTLWPNALRALDRIGLAERLIARGVPEGSGAIRTSRGERLLELSTADLQRRYGMPTLAVHRADLQRTLLEALPPGVVHSGARCIACNQDSAGVTALFADGAHVRGAALIGADGIHSRIRAQLWGAAPPRYAGYTGWRAVTRFDHARLLAGESWGCGARFGIVPMSQGRVYWFATRNAPAGERDAPGGRKQELLDLFGRWHAPIPELIAATDAAAILRNDIYDRPPLPRWSRGRVTLLGDAAHPMTPNLGQGACQAIEDALVLAACLATIADPVAALARYEARRIARANTFVRRSRAVGAVGQWRHALPCALRDALAKATPPRATLRQLDWMLGPDGQA